MLKRLFTSNTRIKLLTVFLMNQSEEYFIRELTRMLDEQINSVRRELDNLKKMGLLRSKTKNRKKYYYINKNFDFLDELKSIFVKALSSHENLAKDIAKMGDIKILALTGIFKNEPTTTVDMLIVGEVDSEKLSEYLNTQVRTQRPVKFAVMNEEDYRYRVSCHDAFIQDIVGEGRSQIPIKKI